MKTISIDRTKRLRDEPHTGHNRWHPDIEPIIEVAPGEALCLETRDAADGQITPGMTVEALTALDPKVAHPLTGPVYVQGAKPGDLLEIEYLDIVPQPHGWTRIRPGAGFLRDLFPDPYLAHWEVRDGYATSPQLAGVRIPEAPFMGTAGLAPSHAQLTAWAEREADLVSRGGFALPPDAQDAVPAVESIASTGLRTMPPRENCGNIDAKQLTQGSRLQIPVNVDGALYSVGDAHYAQGDSECCVTAIEMGATVTVRFRIHAGEAARHDIRFPRFAHPGYFAAPEWAAPQQLHSHDRHAHPRRRYPGRGGSHSGGPQRTHQHDPATARTRLVKGAGLRHLLRGSGFADQQPGRPAQRDGVGLVARRDLRALRQRGCSAPGADTVTSSSETRTQDTFSKCWRDTPRAH